MKAVVLTEYGDIDRLQLREVPDPVPGANEILIRVAAASINPVDWKLRSGALKGFMPLELPAVLGRDVSGTVAAVGPGVSKLAPGTRVMALVNRGYAELVVAAVDGCAEVPAGLDLVEAAALPLAGLTGAQLIEEVVNARDGEVVLVTGALGSVGRAAVHAARARGVRVLAGVRGRQRAEAAKLGVELVAIDDDAEIAKLPPLDAIADTVGPAVAQKLVGKVKTGGRVGCVAGEPPGAKELGLQVRSMLTHPDPKRLAELARAAAERKLVLPIAERFPLREAARAQKVAEKGAGGKVLLIV